MCRETTRSTPEGCSTSEHFRHPCSISTCCAWCDAHRRAPSPVPRRSRLGIVFLTERISLRSVNKSVPFNKRALLQEIVLQLRDELESYARAARAAHAEATDPQSKAENKYDTRGLEAAYLATGQARRAEAIRQAIANWRQFRPRPYDASKGIQLGALVCLVDSDDKEQQLFLGPDGGSMKLVSGAQLVQVISSEAPLGGAMLGKCEGDEVSIQVASIRQQFEVLRVH